MPTQEWMTELGLFESAIPCSSCGRRMLQHEVKTQVDALMGYGLFGSVCLTCRKVYCHECLKVGGTPCPTCAVPTHAAGEKELASIGVALASNSATAPSWPQMPGAVGGASGEPSEEQQQEGPEMAAVDERISKDEFTSAKLQQIYHQAYMDATIGADGNIVLTLDGIKMFGAVDPANALMRLMVLFGVKPQATRLQLLELCNRINDGLIMLRATCPAGLPQLTLLLDHYIVTTAGVTGEEVVDETRRFRSVVAGIPPLDAEHILA